MPTNRVVVTILDQSFSHILYLELLMYFAKVVHSLSRDSTNDKTVHRSMYLQQFQLAMYTTITLSLSPFLSFACLKCSHRN